MLIKVYEDNPNERTIAQIANILEGGGVVIYPTDTLYAVGCSVKSVQAIGKLISLTGKKSSELTLVCCDLSNIADYATVDNATFRTLKRNVPGPFTFVLKASSKVPDKVLERRKTIGVRVPDNAITTAIVRQLGCPLVSCSVKEDAEFLEYTTDPELINEIYGTKVDAIIDGGYGDNRPSTVVEFQDDTPVVLRQGKGKLI